MTTVTHDPLLDLLELGLLPPLVESALGHFVDEIAAVAPHAVCVGVETEMETIDAS